MVGKSLLLIFVCLSIAFTAAYDDTKSEDEVFRRVVSYLNFLSEYCMMVGLVSLCCFIIRNIKFN